MVKGPGEQIWTEQKVSLSVANQLNSITHPLSTMQVESPRRRAHAHAISPSKPIGTAASPTTLQRSRSPTRHSHRPDQQERGRSRSPAKVDRTHSGSSSVLSETHVHNELPRSRHPQMDMRDKHIADVPPKPKTRRSLSPLKRQKNNTKPVVAESTLPIGAPPHAIEQEFDSLLTHREIPTELRDKLQSLDTRIKENLVRNQAVFNISSLGALASSQDALRPRARKQSERSRASSPVRALIGKSASTVSLSQPSAEDDEQNPLQPPDKRKFFSHHNRSSSSHHSASTSSSGPQLESQSSHLAHSRATRNRSPSPRRPALATSSSHSSTPAYYAKHLLNTSSRKLDIERLKKLRVMVSAETPTWLGDFLFTERGYEGLLKRVGELVEMEWREEIHDDKALHELLRTMTYLGDTDKGMLALSSLLFRPYTSQLHHGIPASGSNQKLPTAAPAASIAKEETPPELAMGWEHHPPFGPLVGMLLSERKPGDLTTRKLLIDVLSLLPKMRLPPGLSHSVLKSLKSTREISSSYDLFEELAPLSSHHMLFLLLHNPLQARSLSLLPFIQQSHHPRPFKTYLREIEGVVRDYFWIFCHSRNRFWDWDMFGEEGRRKIEGPKVPGGMTGGVEFEAMAYVTANLRLINNLAASLSQISSSVHPISYQFHASLFDSGLERILAVLRRSSQQYYSELHLAMARFVSLCRASGYRLPRSLDEWCDRPQHKRASWDRLEVGGLSLGAGHSSGVPDDDWKWEDIPKKSLDPRQHQSQPQVPSSPPRPTSPKKAAPSTATAIEPALPNIGSSTGVTPSTSSSSFVPGTGKWLGKGQSAAAFLATTSASDQDFFDQPMSQAATARPIQQQPMSDASTAIDVPLPASPVKGSAMLSSPTKAHRNPWETIGNPHAARSTRSRPCSPTKSRPTSGAHANPPTTPSKDVQRGFEPGAVASLEQSAYSRSQRQRYEQQGMGVTSTSNAASHVVKVGTAKDRIKLWEGRMVRD